MRISGSCKKWYFSKADGDVYILFEDSYFPKPSTSDFINWGDHHEVNGAFEIMIPYNSYILNNTPYVHVMVDPECPASSGTNVFDWTKLKEYFCDSDEKDSGWLYETSGYNRMKYRVSVYRNAFYHYDKSELISQYYNGSKWKKERAAIDVNISVNRKKSNCVQFEAESDPEDCNNCRSKTSKTRAGTLFGPPPFIYYCTGDVVGTFQKVDNGVTLSDIVTLDFLCCPE